MFCNLQATSLVHAAEALAPLRSALASISESTCFTQVMLSLSRRYFLNHALPLSASAECARNTQPYACQSWT